MVERNRVTRIAALAVAMLVVVGLVGVGGSALTLAQDEDDEQETTTEADANVRVAHMSPDAPDVDVQVDNETVLQNVGFSDVSDYLAVEAGDHQVTLVSVEDEQTVFDGQLTLEAGTNYTVTAAGEVSENGTEAFEPIALTDATEPPEGDDASVRLVHVSPDAGPVDVTVNQTGDVLFDNATFGNETEYVTVPSGVYTLNVRQATEDNDGTIVESFNVSLVNETSYTAFAAGYAAPEDAPANTSLDLFTAVDVTNNPEGLLVGTPADDETDMDEETEVEDETTEETEDETADALETTTIDDEETTAEA
ncbi:DUF4397 domain-containing protein [Halorussus amylolyticus]|uniref:DUF4397 domain-containing protein n=1 Tax=Halorussus amylolyticus TaxID=1126242 RepID=UPI0010473B00|nr:DUF4397 domain-containing protein [Halorussus amylolyticus]